MERSDEVGCSRPAGPGILEHSEKIRKGGKAAGYVRGGAPDKTVSAVGTVRTDGKQLFVATGDKWLEIKELQLAGKKRMSADAFLRGFREIEACKFV